MLIAVALYLLVTLIISFLMYCAMQYFYKDTEAQQELDRYRRYYHLDNPDDHFTSSN